jgi:hypothetical protein
MFDTNYFFQKLTNFIEKISTFALPNRFTKNDTYFIINFNLMIVRLADKSW